MDQDPELWFSLGIKWMKGTFDLVNHQQDKQID